MKTLNNYINESEDILLDFKLNSFINESKLDSQLLSEGLISKIGKWLGMKSGKVKNSISNTIKEIKGFPKTVQASYIAALQSTEDLNDKEKKEAQSLLSDLSQTKSDKETIEKNIDWLKDAKNTESLFYSTIAKMTYDMAKKENDKESTKFCEKIIKNLPNDLKKETVEAVKQAEKTVNNSSSDNDKENTSKETPAEVAADKDQELIKKVLKIADLGTDYYKTIQDKLKSFISSDNEESTKESLESYKELITEASSPKDIEKIAKSEEGSECLILAIIAYKGLEKLGLIKNAAALGALIKGAGFEGNKD